MKGMRPELQDSNTSAAQRTRGREFQAPRPDEEEEAVSAEAQRGGQHQSTEETDAGE